MNIKVFQLTALACVLLLVSCGSTYDFPVSDDAPAAQISVKVSTDKYDNTIFDIETKYLVSPERLNPPHKIYVVWAETEQMGVVNLGKLYSESGDKASLRTLTPFNPVEVFITAEESAYSRYPRGTEISRVAL